MAIIESDARPTGLQLKKEAKLLTVVGLNTKHADCPFDTPVQFNATAATEDASNWQLPYLNQR